MHEGSPIISQLGVFHKIHYFRQKNTELSSVNKKKTTQNLYNFPLLPEFSSVAQHESICFEIGFPKLQIHKYVASNTKGCNFDIKFAPKSFCQTFMILYVDTSKAVKLV